ncbi:MAG TPA: riboflavin synthase [Candidatus Binatia bacterium]
MFTGIIEDVGEVVRWERRGGAGVLVVRTGLSVKQMELGASIAVNGACLTVTEKSRGAFKVDVSPETLKRTTFGGLKKDAAVNLERPMTLSDRLGGHLVTGHIDGVAAAEKIEPKGDYTFYTFRVSPPLSRLLVPKGSVAVDGISLTVNACGRGRFSIAAIPFTLKHTNLRHLRVGARVNIETDLIGKYVQRLLRQE